MAALAARRGRQVAAALATCYLAVMAARTSRADTHIGVELGWCPAAVALVAGRAVGTGADVIGALAGGAAAVVATGAAGSRGKGAVVGFGTFPLAGRTVAAFTTGCGRQMAAVLVTCNLAVMAARTSRADAHIGVELGWCPAAVALVAGRAVGTGADVIGALASGLCPVVTTGTGSRAAERAVIRLRARPAGGGLVATLAIGRGRNVGCRLACRNGTVVTIRAAGANRHIGMELGRQPANRRVLVAGCAVGTGADVIDPFASGLGTIVTTCADGC